MTYWKFQVTSISFKTIRIERYFFKVRYLEKVVLKDHGDIVCLLMLAYLYFICLLSYIKVNYKLFRTIILFLLPSVSKMYRKIYGQLGVFSFYCQNLIEKFDKNFRKKRRYSCKKKKILSKL